MSGNAWKRMSLEATGPMLQALIAFALSPEDLAGIDLPALFLSGEEDLYALARSIETHELDGIVIIGGFQAYRALTLIHAERKRFPALAIPMVVLPASIDNNLPVHAVLTKADKLGRGAGLNVLQAVRKDLQASYGDSVGVQTLSSESKAGVDELRQVVARWLAV